MKEIIAYKCESCGEIHIDQYNITSCENCDKEICPECSSLNDELCWDCYNEKLNEEED